VLAPPSDDPPRLDVAVDVSIVVPCYRDERTLPALFARLGPVIAELKRSVELVIVDDGSPDRTGETAISLAATAPYPTTVVRLLRNFGQHAAVFAGFGVCRGSVVVTMDSDMQYPPEEIKRLIAALSVEFPVVSGYRQDRQDRLSRRFITFVLGAWLRRQTRTSLRDFGSMFRAYDRTVIERLNEFQERRRFIPALVAWLGIPVKEIPVAHAEQGPEGSRYRLGSLIEMVLDLVTGYSIFPMRVAVVLGLIGSGIGFIATTGFVVYRVAIGAGVARQVGVDALLFFLLGIQLLILTLVGEYVGRIYTEAKGRPYYIVREIVRH
jgi:undecaprenyl-phosphate 4-deoxy-4-formamido-L-arabinose transferase